MQQFPPEDPDQAFQHAVHEVQKSSEQPPNPSPTQHPVVDDLAEAGNDSLNVVANSPMPSPLPIEGSLTGSGRPAPNPEAVEPDPGPSPHKTHNAMIRENRTSNLTARTRCTYAKLTVGLGRAIEKKGLKNVTVADIAHEAHVSRGTVYLHFKSKDDICLQLENAIISHCCAILFATGNNTGDPGRMFNTEAPVSKRMIIEKQIDRIHGDRWKKDSSFELVPYSSLAIIISYLRSQKELLQPLTSEKGDPTLMPRATTSVARIFQMRSRSVRTYKFTYQGLPQKYGITAMLSGVMGIIEAWISGGMVESDETILDYIHIATMSSPAMLAL